jgi:hypothetical protein
MGEALEHCTGESFRGEDLGPFMEGQVACHRCGGAFIALTEGLEEQLGAGLSTTVVTKS